MKRSLLPAILALLSLLAAAGCMSDQRVRIHNGTGSSVVIRSPDFWPKRIAPGRSHTIFPAGFTAEDKNGTHWACPALLPYEPRFSDYFAFSNDLFHPKESVNIALLPGGVTAVLKPRQKPEDADLNRQPYGFPINGTAGFSY